MRYVSLFSGAGGMDLGADQAGWECVAQVENDKNCRQVLAHHWPDVPKWGDIAEVYGRDLPAAEAIIFGSPCQDLSVAGQRRGLDGDKSSLFFQAIRIIKEMRDAGNQPLWVVWENVAGALSSHQGQDFAQVLHELADAGALVLEWAVLDARWFGVPQRRRRVFLVACFDPRTAERCPDPLLPVGPRVRRDPRPGDEAGPNTAGTARGGAAGGVVADEGIVTGLTGGLGSGGPDAAHAQAGWLVPALTTRCGNTQDDQQTAQLVPFVKTVRSGARDADGNLPPEVWAEQSVAPTLNAMDNGSESRATVIAIDSTWSGAYPPSIDVSPPLKQAHGTVPAIPDGLGVRRLTPRECERLMGWPDDHTLVTNARGKPMADSPRYKMCGNGVASPVMAWVAAQINNATTSI